MSAPELIYRSAAMSAFFHHGSSPLTLVVFSGAALVGGAGERPRRGFLERADVSAVIIVAHRRDWYPIRETMPCVAAIRARLGDARVVTYGASMGGYGAIRYAAALGACHAVALAPQYSIDPAVIRLRSDPFVVNFRPGLHAGMEIGHVPCPVDIIFDPRHENDCEHVRLITQRVACRLTPCRHAGHALELLFGGPDDVPGLVTAFLADDLGAVRARVRRSKRLSVSFHLSLAGVLLDRKPGLARWALERACALPPLGTDDEVSRLRARQLLGQAEAGIAEMVARYERGGRETSRWLRARALGGVMASCGRSGEALEWFRRAAAHAPDDELALGQVAGALVGADRLDEAAAIARDLIGRHDLPAAHLVLSQVLARRGDVAAAIAPALRALLATPANHQWRWHLSALLSRVGRAAEAEALHLGAVRSIGDAGSWLGWSRFLAPTTRRTEALEAARRAVVLAPSNIMARNHLATLLLAGIQVAAGDEAEALALCRASVAVWFGGAAALAQRARVEARLGLREAALASARAAVGQEPYMEGYRALLVNLLVQANDPEGAAGILDAAPGVATVPLLHSLARLHLGRGDVAAAIATGRQAVALAPDDADLRGELARWLLQAGESAAAEVEARLAIALAPAAAGMRLTLAAILEQDGRLAEAVAACREGVGVVAESGGLRARLAGLLAAAGDRAGAFGEIEAAVGEGIVSAELLAARGRLLLQDGRPADALAAARDAVALAPDHPGFLGLLARCLLVEGYLGEAEGFARRAAAAAPEAAWLRDLLATIERTGPSVPRT